jgi:nucleoside-diphosphate-sugar epimerase
VTVLVTGAAGFVGSHVARQLLGSGTEVVALVRPGSSRRRLSGLDELQIVEADLSDTGALQRQLGRIRPQACIHLAWYAEPGKYLDSPQNVESLRTSLNLLETLAQIGCSHLVGVGTCFEYQMAATPLQEESPTRPETLYAATKLAFMLVGVQRAAQLGIKMAWARLFYLFGPFEDERRLVPAMITTLTAGHEFSATSGDQVRDYLHVDDVAAGLCALSLLRMTGTFNVCSGHPVKLADLMRTLSELLGRPDLLRLGAVQLRRWEPMFVCGDNQRLRTEAQWSPRYSLRDGLASTIDWWTRSTKRGGSQHQAK